MYESLKRFEEASKVFMLCRFVLGDSYCRMSKQTKLVWIDVVDS